jgi:site-specific DNA-methyltransferase (adenine-specific)
MYNNIYNIDILNFFKSVPSDTVDLIFTSPPYNCGIDYDSWDDNLDWNVYINWCHQWLSECFRVLKPEGGRIALNVLIGMDGVSCIQDDVNRISPYAEFYNLIRGLGFYIKANIIWLRATSGGKTAWGSYMSASAPHIFDAGEIVMIAYKNTWKKPEKGESTMDKDEFMKACHGLWYINPEHKSLTKVCFPLDLAKRVINLLTFKNDIVIDPFSGSGTTCSAANLLQRRWAGCDISSNYCQIAVKRIQDDFHSKSEIY